ncbi:hypothetical protein BLA60_31570 [Actinophytocola xinjiangensis]|uniref:Uncharacterized protein n=1 Tax=Actinophytocola xinjiangensis TaxID=485602 RepID=A0A7Z0WHA4_9PSEU|nr:hypothetical protein [Actinophytocola xinjiangensis]OLF06507.1 hypothetical protein BLA60_31570 [Actinophytocola xinjiangensis]
MEDGAVDPQPDPENRQRIVDTARLALAAMNAGSEEGAVDRVSEAVAANPTHQADAQDVMLLLFQECSAMVTALNKDGLGPLGGPPPVKMQVYDDYGREIPIDEADPPVRTAVRTLLAEVHGDREAARTHIEIALANAAPAEMVTLMIQALRWTIRLFEECDTRDVPVAGWITSALS